jgi:ABC-type phosphate/phosphonate transport system ATPase subunit
MPAHFAPREELLAQVRDDLLEPSNIEAARIVGLVGMGGSGKSVLARALARDEQICRAFADGIVWLELTIFNCGG